MERILVINNKIVPLKDILFIIFTFLGTIIFFVLWIYKVFNNNCTNSKILIKSTSRLSMDYQDEIDYYYLYDKINFNFSNKTYYLINDTFSKLKVKFGRNVINDYEIVVDDKNRSLINKKILLNINDKIHEFLVVGTYESSNIFESRNVYTNESTLESLYNYSLDEFYYIFISDEYPLLNEDLDLFSSLGHEVEIVTTNMFDNFYTYRIMKDTFLMASVMLFFMFGIYIFDICFLE